MKYVMQNALRILLAIGLPVVFPSTAVGTENFAGTTRSASIFLFMPFSVRPSGNSNAVQDAEVTILGTKCKSEKSDIDKIQVTHAVPFLAVRNDGNKFIGTLFIGEIMRRAWLFTVRGHSKYSPELGVTTENCAVRIAFFSLIGRTASFSNQKLTCPEEYLSVERSAIRLSLSPRGLYVENAMSVSALISILLATKTCEQLSSLMEVTSLKVFFVSPETTPLSLSATANRRSLGSKATGNDNPTLRLYMALSPLTTLQQNLVKHGRLTRITRNGKDMTYQFNEISLPNNSNAIGTIAGVLQGISTCKMSVAEKPARPNPDKSPLSNETFTLQGMYKTFSPTCNVPACKSPEEVHLPAEKIAEAKGNGSWE